MKNRDEKTVTNNFIPAEGPVTCSVFRTKFLMTCSAVELTFEKCSIMKNRDEKSETKNRDENFVPLEGPKTHSVSGMKFLMVGCSVELTHEKCSVMKKPSRKN